MNNTAFVAISLKVLALLQNNIPGVLYKAPANFVSMRRFHSKHVSNSAWTCLRSTGARNALVVSIQTLEASLQLDSINM
jgi:hypothetical protein